MPNSLTANGLVLATQAELVANLTTQFQQIYGNDINLDPDTPDGQMLNVFVQYMLDLQDLIMQLYNSFDPDLAFGVTLDERVAINGIQRQAGTFSVTNVTLVTSQSLNLYGLDQSVQPIYTVADNAGNQWQLQTSQLGLSAGTHVLSFQAANPGAVLTIPNTITVPVSIVLGVTSINNPTIYTSLGINEETDSALKVRRQKSVALPSQGYLQGLLAALLNTTGVTFAFVEENNTGTTNSDGVPGHSIWVIVAGSAADADVARAIYNERNAGCGMYGAKTFTIVQVDGSSFPVYWDIVVTVPLFIEFSVASLDGINPPNIAAIRAGLPTSFVPNVASQVNANQVASLVQVLDSNTFVTGVGFSIETVQTITLSGIPASGTFKLSYNGVSTGVLNWNDSAGTIQTALRLLSGLSAVTVSGSLASQSLVVTMTGVTNPFKIGANTNSLQTVAPAAITFGFFSTYASILAPALKKNQFIVTAADIVVLPMIASCPACQFTIVAGVVTHTTAGVASGGSTLQFTGLGGYGSYVYSVSGSGSINASTGLYTSNAIGTDTVTITDALGNTATCTVTVT